MTPNELANKAADEVLLTIERDKAIIKARIAEAIKRVLLTHQVTPSAGGLATWLDRPPIAIEADLAAAFALAGCDND